MAKQPNVLAIFLHLSRCLVGRAYQLQAPSSKLWESSHHPPFGHPLQRRGLDRKGFAILDRVPTTDHRLPTTKLPTDFLQQPPAPEDDIVVCLFEVSGVPGVGHFAFPPGVGEEEGDFFLWVAAGEIVKVF